MEDFGLIVRMPKFDELDGSKAMQVLHDHAGEIAQEVEQRIEDRTPEDTGALKEDETYELGQGNELVKWYVGSGYQLAEWHRVYSVYQEGPPLGLQTYTPGEHQMYFRVTTEDIPLITAWAQNLVDQAADAMAEAAEAGATSWEL